MPEASITPALAAEIKRTGDVHARIDALVKHHGSPSKALEVCVKARFNSFDVLNERLATANGLYGTIDVYSEALQVALRATEVAE
jgi:hypothetical protein